MDKLKNSPVNSIEKPGEGERKDQPVVNAITTNTKDQIGNVDILSSSKVIKISDIAQAIGLEPKDIKLPNGRILKNRITWEITNLPEVFTLVNKLREDFEAGRGDCVIIDGACPTWLLPTISHACHPASTAVKYPQGGPEATLPISGVSIDGEGEGKDVNFKTDTTGTYNRIEFSLTQPQIDTEATVKSLVAPGIQKGKGVLISGRGPIAIAAGLAEAYAHQVPFIANFQPGTGYVVSISHDATHPIGTIVEIND